MWTKEIIDDVIWNNDIVKIIGARIKLTKRGENYWGCCPFHHEKTPSFSVSPSKQRYYCFGCLRGGNVINFLKEYDNSSFCETMEKLAKEADIVLPEQKTSDEVKESNRKRKRLYQLNEAAAKYYAYQLNGRFGAAGREYLHQRGLTQETISRFGLGYAPDSYNRLWNCLRRKGFSDEELKESGLVRFKENGVANDFFRNRVIYPVLDRQHRIIGFGARALDNGQPKYINLPETLLFDKGNTLYGLDTARNSRYSKYILCEGYMDVITLHQAGLDSAIATLGTALTKRHALQLKCYTDHVLLCFDSDGAGINAAMRAIPLLREAGLEINVVALEPYKDPDEFIRNEGADVFEKRLRKALNFFLFQSDVWKSECRLDDPADLTAFYKHLARELIAFTEPLERYNYLTAVCERHSISRELLQGEVERMSRE